MLCLTDLTFPTVFLLTSFLESVLFPSNFCYCYNIGIIYYLSMVCWTELLG